MMKFPDSGRRCAPTRRAAILFVASRDDFMLNRTRRIVLCCIMRVYFSDCVLSFLRSSVCAGKISGNSTAVLQAWTSHNLTPETITFMNIAILDDYQDSVRHLRCFDLLSDCTVKIFTTGARGTGQLAIRLAPFDVLVLNANRTVLSKALIARLPRLKLIVSTGAPGPHIDVAAAHSHGIAVRSGEDDVVATAELTWTLILAARRKLVQYASLLKQGAWQSSSLHPALNTLGCRVQGQILGLWGYGQVGQQVAAYARAFGMQVRVWGSASSRELAIEHGLETASSQQNLFAESDIVSLHLRLCDATKGIVGAADFGCMKPDALFVNTSHADLVQPGALEVALQQGRPASAAVDVFDTEPPSASSPLLTMENVLATPHLGYVEKHSYERLYRRAFEHILNFIQETSASA